MTQGFTTGHGVCVPRSWPELLAQSAREHWGGASVGTEVCCPRVSCPGGAPSSLHSTAWGKERVLETVRRARHCPSIPQPAASGTPWDLKGILQ